MRHACKSVVVNVVLYGTLIVIYTAIIQSSHHVSIILLVDTFDHVNQKLVCCPGLSPAVGSGCICATVDTQNPVARINQHIEAAFGGTQPWAQVLCCCY